jgi:hypothetical protein
MITTKQNNDDHENNNSTKNINSVNNVYNNQLDALFILSLLN